MPFWPPPPGTVTLDVSRPGYDSRGNRFDSRGNAVPPSTAFTFQVQGVVSVADAMTRPRLGEGSENRFIQDAQLFVQIGTDIQPSDEILYNGVKFIVAGHARGDENQPQTNQSFGWMEFRMQGFG
jgi:hypothetical protein